MSHKNPKNMKWNFKAGNSRTKDERQTYESKENKQTKSIL